MEINLLPIINYEGKKLPVDYSAALQPRDGDILEIIQPVHVKGEAVNMGDCIALTAEGTAYVRMPCDRCTEPAELVVPFTVSERLKKEEATLPEKAEDEDVIWFSGNTFDLDSVVYNSLYMSLPSKVLCREDCKGLCPHCGQNLNFGACGCDTRQTDPRFAVLDQLDL